MTDEKKYQPKLSIDYRNKLMVIADAEHRSLQNMLEVLIDRSYLQNSPKGTIGALEIRHIDTEEDASAEGIKFTSEDYHE